MVWRGMYFFVGAFLLLTTPVSAKPLSKEEADGLWEQLLREERYEAISFVNHEPTPRIFRFEDKRIRVLDGRRGFFGGLIGSGGGWEVIGRLEAEVPTER